MSRKVLITLFNRELYLLLCVLLNMVVHGKFVVLKFFTFFYFSAKFFVNLFHKKSKKPCCSQSISLFFFASRKFRFFLQNNTFRFFLRFSLLAFRFLSQNLFRKILKKHKNIFAKFCNFLVNVFYR